MNPSSKNIQKTIDMRFHWIQDRVHQKQFDINWEPGFDNLANYLRKHYPASHHKTVRTIYLKN